MTRTSETIIFFGSGPVAAKSLELLSQDFTIEAVITKPRPPHHRGPVPVIEVAEHLGLPVHTAASRSELDSLFADASYQSRLAILIDFGIIVSQKVIDYFPLGIVNSHFSLLPEWRGADPITFSILSGQHQTGVSLMMLVAGMDEGPILAQAPYVIPEDITTPELTDALIDLSHSTLKEILPLYIQGDVAPAPQDIEQPATYSRKLTKDDGLIDWSKPAEQIEREIRAFIEWPKSRTTIGGKEVVITRAHVEPAMLEPGAIEVRGKTLLIGCGKSSLAIDRLKPAGKAEMSAEAFLAGYRQLLQ